MTGTGGSGMTGMTGATPQAVRDLPGIPLDADQPVFNEPWEARAFAMTVALHERGLFTWTQWADALSRQIALAQAAGDADLGDTYYQHWLRALESLVNDLPGTGSEGRGA